MHKLQDGRSFDYFTLRNSRNDGGIDVLGWGVYPDRSVLAGQPMKVFLTCENDEATARKWLIEHVGERVALDAQFSSHWTEPQVNYSHLPDENDPVSGGMYPDDWDDCGEEA